MRNFCLCRGHGVERFPAREPHVFPVFALVQEKDGDYIEAGGRTAVVRTPSNGVLFSRFLTRKAILAASSTARVPGVDCHLSYELLYLCHPSFTLFQSWQKN
jgi:hypothetical protein